MAGPEPTLHDLQPVRRHHVNPASHHGEGDCFCSRGQAETQKGPNASNWNCGPEPKIRTNDAPHPVDLGKRKRKQAQASASNAEPTRRGPVLHGTDRGDVSEGLKEPAQGVVVRLFVLGASAKTRWAGLNGLSKRQRDNRCTNRCLGEAW